MHMMIDGNSEEDIEHINHGNYDYVYDEDGYGDDCDQDDNCHVVKVAPTYMSCISA